MKQQVILIDSSTVYEAEATANNLEFIPLMLNINGKTIIDNNKELSISEFYEILKTDVIKTSQSSPGMLKEKWDSLLKQYENIIFFPISCHLSGQYQTALLLAQEEKYQNKVHVINSEAVSDINNEMVRRAVNFLENHPLSELQAFIDQQKEKYVAFILPYQLDTLVRGGRINANIASLINFLKIKPILEFKGSINKFSKTRTFKKAIKEILKEIKQRFPNENGELMILNSLCDDSLKQELITIVNNEKFTINRFSLISNVVAAHTGYNTFVFVYWIK